MARADIEYYWFQIEDGVYLMFITVGRALFLVSFWLWAWKLPRANKRYATTKWGHLVREAQAHQHREQRAALQEARRRRQASTNKWWPCFWFAKGRCCIPICDVLGLFVRRRRREHIQSEVFHLCDQDSDGVLNQWEMLLLAREAGFRGTDQDWNDLYTQLCRGSGRRLEQGIDEATVKRLLDDQSDAGFYCSDDSLNSMVRNLPCTIPNGARAKMKTSVFILCDVDADGVLNREETLRLARLTGFFGSEYEWNEEFQLLCTKFGRSPAQGVDLVSLMRLLDDKANGCYCNDDVLRSLLSSLNGKMEQDCRAGSQCGAYDCHPVTRGFWQRLYDYCLRGSWGHQPRARWLGRTP